MKFETIFKTATECEVCGKVATKVMLLNTPFDSCYLVGTCDADIEHQADGTDWPTVSVEQFKTAWAEVADAAKSRRQLHLALARILDPALMEGQ